MKTSLRSELEALRSEVLLLLESLERLEHEQETSLSLVAPSVAAGARNLVHYVALRERDVRPLQQRLARLGLSSLGRSEGHVRSTLLAVRWMLDCALGSTEEEAHAIESPLPYAHDALEERTEALLGPTPSERFVRIMVTLPSSAAQDPKVARQLIEAGMNCARINAAHDDPDAWEQMVRHVRAASKELGPCKVLVDVPGPKIRIAPLPPGPVVLRWKPERDPRGWVERPARVLLVPEGTPRLDVPGVVVLPVGAEWLEEVAPGDHLQPRDVRGRRRELLVVARAAEGCWTEASRTAYVEPGTTLQVVRNGKAIRSAGTIGALPRLPTEVRVAVGEVLELTENAQDFIAPVRDEHGVLVRPARLPIDPPKVLEALEPGQRVWFDDGAAAGEVEQAQRGLVRVLLSIASPRGVRLCEGKGINVPDVPLPRTGTSARDREALDFAAKHADLVGLSYVRSPEDVRALREALDERGARDLGVVLKIEERSGFEQLPALLLEALRRPPVGVMIARGDLAMECGFERLAELQEEVLWLCEAAQVPCIWATQVLDTMARTGVPSRAEVSDAALGGRAECVMLNKGPRIVSVVRALEDILRRMQAHQTKKASLLRALRSWRFRGE